MKRVAGRAVSALMAVIVCSACGKKGPPLPPLLKLPAAPADVSAERRASTVALRFTVPAANTDGTRPANVQRVDIYGITAPQNVTDAQVLKLGTKIGSVDVKAPKDPNQTVEPEDTDVEMEPPGGNGLDQGTAGHVEEELSTQAFVPVDLAQDAKAPKKAARDADGPLLPPPAVLNRIYMGVAVSGRGKKGPVSKRVLVGLQPPPAPPSAATITYDEAAVTITWIAWADRSRASSPGETGVLPSTALGAERPAIAYNVYDATSSAKLTATPIAATRFSDARIVWGEKRCYVVRTVATFTGIAVESDALSTPCETLTDTFAPAAPKKLQAVPSDGVINLIWDPNTEKDLVGYLVLRGVAPGDTLQRITPEPIAEPRFEDKVQPGVQYVYAIKAVDNAGNESELSNRIQESAR